MRPSEAATRCDPRATAQKQNDRKLIPARFCALILSAPCAMSLRHLEWRCDKEQGPARRQCAPRMERREAQHPDRKGCARLRTARRPPDRKGGIKGPRKPLAPPGAPFPSLLGGLPIPLGGRKKGNGLPGADQRTRATAHAKFSAVVPAKAGNADMSVITGTSVLTSACCRRHSFHFCRYTLNCCAEAAQKPIPTSRWRCGLRLPWAASERRFPAKQ